MNVAQIKCLAVFSIFAIIGFGPVSPGCLIGLYIVALRPIWFGKLVGDLYEKPFQKGANFSPKIITKSRIKTFCVLFCLLLIDIAPVPVTPTIAFLIILSKPLWFYLNIKHIYGDK
ncbi:MAG: hypothetical protein WCJ11_00185 [Methylococcaceae bacterium]